jgi:hypothetical protein
MSAPDTGTAPGTAGPAAGRNPVTALSGAVLRAARATYAEHRTDLAARAAVRLDVVDGVEDGTCPAWVLPYAEFAALAEAISALNPQLGLMWETAAACDLLLSCVMDGDQAMATDVLADDDTRDLAVALLRWAVTGQLRAPGHLACARVPGRQPGRLLDDGQLSLLRQRAAALAGSGSPDAWVGTEILAVFGGGR